MSIFVYILYIWVSEIFGLSLDIRHAVEPLHASPLFWLTLLLVGGGCFLLDVLVEYLRITYVPNGSDFVRILMKDKKGDGWNDLQKEVKISEEDLERIRKKMEDIH